MHNSKYHCHMAACCTYHRPTYFSSLLNRSHKKSLSLNEKYRRVFWQAEKDKIERVTGLGRRTREEIAQWNQMTALRFQTGERYQTSRASLRGSNYSRQEIKQEFKKHNLQFIFLTHLWPWNKVKVIKPTMKMWISNKVIIMQSLKDLTLTTVFEKKVTLKFFQTMKYASYITMCENKK